MAVATQKRVASLMRKTLDNEAALNNLKLRIKKGQVEQILLSYIKDGNLGAYSELIKVLQRSQLNDENYRNLLKDSLLCVVLLGRDFSQFVDVVCHVEWMSRSPELVELFTSFLLNLVTAHTYHCQRVLAYLITLFKVEGDNWDNSPPEESTNKWSNVHTVIAQIVATVPMTSDLLLQIIIDQFPYYKAGCSINRAFIHNLIWITKYLPPLRESIMTAIVNRMVIMDVNLVDLTNKKPQIETMFEMEVDEVEDDVTETLDCCMLEMLQWLEEERGPVLDAMCSVFERVILPTHGIRHVQFLLLYSISISQQCADRVLSALWTVAAGRHGLGPGALSTRRTAAAHLAGLLARCARVPNTRLVKYLRGMAEWCHAYASAAQEAAAASDNCKVHGAFHAVCHAVFYLVAFKHQHLFASKENILFVESLNLPRLVTCALNPLRTCPPQVTRAFASTTRAHQVVYCQAIIEKNTRHTLQASTSPHYDEWFPYDPYTLPMSGKTIWPLCIDYKDWLKAGDDATQYSGMKRKLDACDDDDDFLVSATTTRRLAGSLSSCISPGFKTSDNVLI